MYQDTIERNRLATTLGVPKGSDTGVETEALTENVLHVLGLDGVEVDVVRALRNNDDRLALADLAVLETASAKLHQDIREMHLRA